MSAAPLPAAVARRLLLDEVVSAGTELVPLGGCLGRVCGAPVRAPVPLPGFDNAAMDGYAVRAADLAGGPVPLRIVAESRAGHPAGRGLGPGEAARISTGATIPAGADAVVPVEEAREEDGAVVALAAPVEPGAHVRRAGEDLAAGAEALPAGWPIGPAEVGVLASLGLAEVECARRPRLAVLTGGDELLEPGQPPEPGRIYDSNRFALLAQAKRAGADAFHAGGMPDDLARTREAIAAALDAEFVVLAGGVSVGRHDHVKEALAELGVEQLFWRVALRPGGPTWGGVLRRPGGRPTLVFGLPGNPVSAMVTFRLFAQPALLAATGRDPEEGRATAVLAEPVAKRAGRALYLRCRLERTEQGWLAHLTNPRQGSHVLSSMLGADCLAALPAGPERVEAGERVGVLLL
ncbi:MAG: molybdopterin molybdotransferase MoeA [Solirubrobacterales bacterium]